MTILKTDAFMNRILSMWVVAALGVARVASAQEFVHPGIPLTRSDLEALEGNLGE